MRRLGPTKASSSKKVGLGLHATYRLARMLDTDVKASLPCAKGASAMWHIFHSKGLKAPGPLGVRQRAKEGAGREVA